MIPDRLIAMLQSAESKDRDSHHFPPTEVFNERWMLRLVFDALEHLEKTVGVSDAHPLKFSNGSKWYSEARLRSPFRPRSKKDPLGESSTQADGVIGHFELHEDTKSRFQLMDGASQFTVIEAKIFSNLSSRTTNASGYNQAARTIACMADAIKPNMIGALESVGFFVAAPSLEKRRARKPNTNLEACLEPDSLRLAIRKRIETYEKTSRREDVEQLQKWERDFHDLVGHLHNTKRLRVLDWERDIIDPIADIDKKTGQELREFYRCCLDYA
jgi:hypothetical protein